MNTKHSVNRIHSVSSGFNLRCHFLRGNLLIKVEVRGRRTSDQSRSAAKAYVLNCPLHEDDEPTLKLDYVHKVNEHPDQPRWQPGKVQPKDIRNRSRASDDSKVAFIEVFEWSLLRLPAHFPLDCICGVRPLLHGDLRDTCEWLSVLVFR